MIVRFLGALALWVIASAALARDLPAVFDVTGVAADDVLNIRAEPSAEAAVLRSIPPDAKGVEVVALSQDGKWGMVSTGEGNGWVAMRFLTAQPAPGYNTLPRPMTCMGTEPFWILVHDPLHDRIEMLGEPEKLLAVGLELAAPEGYFVLSTGADDEKALYKLTITRQVCGDGMSDRQFGFDARLFISGPGGNRLVSGCCTLDQR